MVGTRDEGDDRNNLYLQYVRFVDVVRPKFFVLENVKGLLTLKKGYFKEDIVKRFTELGYNVDFKLLKPLILVYLKIEREYSLLG